MKYPDNMDKECIEICNVLNSLPGIRTFESCCGHLKDIYSIWFLCDNLNTISRLGKTVDGNYSDGRWELLVDSTDTHPVGVFWLRSKKPFESFEKMNNSLNGFIHAIHNWFDHKFDNYFSKNPN